MKSLAIAGGGLFVVWLVSQLSVLAGIVVGVAFMVWFVHRKDVI